MGQCNCQKSTIHLARNQSLLCKDKLKHNAQLIGVCCLLVIMVRLNSFIFFLLSLSDNELCHFTSKSISNKKDTFKSFMAFDITICKLIFRVVVGNQIVVSQ